MKIKLEEMKSLLLIILSFILNSTGYSQQKGPNISFEKESHNFGKILETNGPVTFTYNFRNTGSEPLIVQNVQPSCGCTTPEWSRKPIAPGESGFIKATFNPAGRPGPFSKSINVTTNGIQSSVILKFNGEVIGKQPVVEKYPFEIDKLRFSSVYISFGKVSPNITATRTLDIMNSGNAPITLSFTSVPSHITVFINPSIINPNQRGTIEFTYDPKKKNDWGFVSDVVYYTMNGKKDGKYKINLSASIEDNYSNATPQQLANAPKLVLEKNIFNIGNVKAGTNTELSFKFKNSGKTNLEIHKVVSTCGCTNVKAKQTIVKPGAESEITGVFSSAGQKGAINKTITVITNDPNNLNMILWIRGTVE